MEELTEGTLEEADMDLQAEFRSGTIHGEKEVKFWKDVLQASGWVIEVLTQGYVLPFEQFPEKEYDEPNNKSAIQEMEFVRQTVRKWEKEGVVEFVKVKPKAVSPLTVVSRKTAEGVAKKRLCFDGSRFINPRLKKEKVKLAHLQAALEITKKGDWQAKYDLTNAYFHIRICEEHQPFLGASFDSEDGSRQFFQFRVMPFGLATAVHAMTKMTKPLQAYANKRGIRHSIYIDDGRVVAESEEEVKEHYREVLGMLTAAGWQIAQKKSDKLTEVAKEKEYLGFVIDTEEMTVRLTEDKKSQVIHAAKEMEAAVGRYLRVKDLASLVGKVAAAEPALGSLVPFTTRRAYGEIEAEVGKSGWSSKVKISTELAEDFRVFRMRIDEFNGTPIRTQATEVSVVSIIGEPSEFVKQKFIKNHKREKEIEIWAGDASATAVCAFSVMGKNSFFFKRSLSEEEMKKSSGFRELLTVKYVLQDMKKEEERQEESRTIYWLTDSENLVAFLNKGSGKKQIHDETLEIISLARALNVNIIPIHLRREDPRIKIADAGSKSADSDDWSIDDENFRALENKFGKFTVDLFADEANFKVSKFYSAYYSPKTSGVEAFAQSWAGEKAWACPPIKLVIRTIRKITREPLSGLLIVPDWKSAQYRPLIFGAHQKLKWPFQEVHAFRPSIQQTSGAGTSLRGVPKFDMLALFFSSIR